MEQVNIENPWAFTSQSIGNEGRTGSVGRPVKLNGQKKKSPIEAIRQHLNELWEVMAQYFGCLLL